MQTSTTQLDIRFTDGAAAQIGPMDYLTIVTNGFAGIEQQRLADDYYGSVLKSNSDSIIQMILQFKQLVATLFRITSSGEMGVNTTAPVEKLGISGR